MPQDPYRQINGPDGPINFPSNMSDEDVTTAMRKLYPPRNQGTGAPGASIQAHTPTNWERLQEAIPVLKDVTQSIKGNKPFSAPMPAKDVEQLIFPERVFSPMEQAQHPIRTGIDEILGSLTSPENLLLMRGMSGPMGKLIPRLASGGFAATMGKGAIEAGQQAVQAQQAGQTGEAKRLATHAVLGGLMGVAAGAHAGGLGIKDSNPIPKREVEAPKPHEPGKIEINPIETKPFEPEPTPFVPIKPTEELTKPYGPPKVDFKGKVPEENLGFDPRPPKDYGTEARADVERRMGGALPRGQSERRVPAAIEVAGQGVIPPKTGEVVEDLPRKDYPSAQTMIDKGRAKDLEYAQRDYKRAVKEDNGVLFKGSEWSDDVTKAHDKLKQATLNWAQWAKPEDIQSTLNGIRTNLEATGQQLDKMQDLQRKLFGGQISLYKDAKGKIPQVTREQFRATIGSNLPPIPKGFLDQLAPDMAQAVMDAPPKMQRQTVIKLWASAYINERTGKVFDEYNRTSDLARTLTQAKGIDEKTVIPRRQLEDPRKANLRTLRVKVTPPDNVAVSSTTPEGQEAARPQQSVQEATTTQKAGEPTFSPTDTHPFTQLIKDIEQGIVYHGTTKELGTKIKQIGLEGMSVNNLVKRVADKVGVDLKSLTKEQKEELASAARSYNMQLGTASVTPSPEIAQRWAGKGGEFPARVAAILTGSERMENYVATKGEPEVLKFQLTEAGKKNSAYLSHLRDLKQLEADVKSGEYTADEALKFALGEYRDIRIKPSEVQLFREPTQPATSTERLAHFEKYYRDRLRDPELLSKSIPLQGGEYGVPVGETRRTGLGPLRGTKEEVKADFLALKGKEGFPNLRIESWIDAGYNLAWGEKASLPKSLKEHLDLGRQLGYSDAALKDFAQNYDKITPSTKPEDILESRIKKFMMKGMARGTAERMAKEAIEKERGSLSLRPIPANQRPSLNPLPRIADTIDRVANVGGLLEKSPEEMQARFLTRGFAADLRLKHLQIEAKFKDMVDAHDNDGKTEFRSFMDAGEGKPGATFLKPEDQAVAQEFHKMFEARWDNVKKITGQDGGIENYLSHLWEKPGLAKRAISSILYAKKPIEGRATFTKQRFYDYASEGLDKGLKPITYNPIRMQMTALFEVDRFIAAHDLKDQYKAAGLTSWFKMGEKPPQGWMRLNDKIFEPKIMDEGALKQYGTYYAPPDVAKIFNRYVSPGLTGDPTYNTIRSYGNTINQMNLGISGYHGIFISLVSSMSDTALGIEKILNNHDVGGFKNLFRGTIGTFIASSAVRDFKLGRAIQNEAILPTGDPRLQAYVKDIVRMGGSFDQDPFYENSQGRGFFKALATGHPVEAIGTGVQKFSRPIMKYYVPRIKLGMAAHMMEAKMDYLLKQGVSDPFTITSELSKIWDSVDNRAGQMVYDNLFWNKVAKDLSFLTVRAVGWDYGSAREYGGAAKDLAQQTAKVLRGEKPEMSSRMAFTIATPLVIGTLGAVTTYLATGKAPQKSEDYFYPPSGMIGSNGKPERMSYPSYMKDMFAFKNAPATTLIHKLHPTWEQAAELYHNADFYNTEIYGPGDPTYQQGLDTLKWFGKSTLPFSGRMAYQRVERGADPFTAGAESFLGLQPAPTYVTQSKAEELAFELAKRTWQAGPITRDDITHRETFDKFRGQLAQGSLKTDDLSSALQTGKLRPSDLDRLFDEQSMSRLEAEVSRLKLSDALKVMQLADTNEKQQLKPILLNVLDRDIDKLIPEEQAIMMEKVQKALQ